MQLDERLKDFIASNINEDTSRLLLSRERHEDIDIKKAVEQIECRRAIKDKLPDWYECHSLVFPSKLAAEQCSSIHTARYKQRLVEASESLIDLTGGLGVDASHFANKCSKVIYIEREAHYCQCAKHNFCELGLTNIEVINTDAVEFIKTASADTIYLDPARRKEAQGKRFYAIEDCQPDLATIWQELKIKASRSVIVKLSPMLDIKQALSILPFVEEIHILSVKNDCKEILFITKRDTPKDYSPKIICIDLSPDTEKKFEFNFQTEQEATTEIASDVGEYLYEPNVSIMKGGAYKSVAQVFGLKKLDRHTHLYTSSIFAEDFPGRCFRVQKHYSFDKNTQRFLTKSIDQANISIRNFPISVDEIRRKFRIAEGGDLYMFFTTMNGKKVVIECIK